MREYALLLHSTIRPNCIVSLRFITLELWTFWKFDVGFVRLFLASFHFCVYLFRSCSLLRLYYILFMNIALHAQGHFLAIIIIPMRSVSSSFNIDLELHIFVVAVVPTSGYCYALVRLHCKTRARKKGNIDEMKQKL